MSNKSRHPYHYSFTEGVTVVQLFPSHMLYGSRTTNWSEICSNSVVPTDLSRSLTALTPWIPPVVTDEHCVVKPGCTMPVPGHPNLWAILHHSQSCLRRSCPHQSLTDSSISQGITVTYTSVTQAPHPPDARDAWASASSHTADPSRPPGAELLPMAHIPSTTR